MWGGGSSVRVTREQSLTLLKFFSRIRSTSPKFHGKEYVAVLTGDAGIAAYWIRPAGITAIHETRTACLFCLAVKEESLC